jgi:hypothetical protein
VHDGEIRRPQPSIGPLFPYHDVAGRTVDEMAAVDNRSGGGASERDRFIPVRKTEILDALIGHGRLRNGEAEKFRLLARLLGAIYHFEYFDRLETLRDDYYYFNPDLPHDTKVDPAVLARAHDELVETLVGVLHKADFVELEPDELERSHRERHMLKVEIALPAGDFREVRFFRRGHHRSTTEISEWFGLRKRTVEFDVYDHLVLMVMVKPEGEITSQRLRRRLAKSRLRPGTILIKYFRDIARGDLNMLFPNVRVVLSLFDMFSLGLPGIAGGVPILLKLLPTISVLFVVIAAYLGYSGTVRDDDTRQALAAVSALVALGGYLMRQWLRYQRQSLKYQKEISDNVYFRNLNNNAGALHHIVGSAEEQECKEAFLAYYFLATAGGPLTQGALASHVEGWLTQTFRVEAQFEVAEALAKLERLKLLRRDGEAVEGLPLDEALKVLDRTWGSFFPLIPEPAPPSS